MKNHWRVSAFSMFFLCWIPGALSIWSQCEIDPFPPFPPSPPEFRKAVTAQSTGNGVYLSWQQIPDQEGFLVSVCNGPDGFKPLAELEENSLLVTDIPESGTYVFQVKAFVKVDQNFVFNGGSIAKAEVQAARTQPVTGEVATQIGVEVKPSSPPKQTLSFEMVHNKAREYPGFQGSSSFYSPIYPEVRNPLAPFTVDGVEIPALLTDDGIERTVARIYKKKGIQVAASPIRVKPTEPQNSPTNQSMTGDQGSSKPTRESPGEPEGQIETVNEMTPGKDPVKIPSQSVPSKEPVGSSEQTKSMGAQRGLFLLIGVLILGVIYFLFRKEAQ